ncbi:hypothetical protein vseg_019358 [Gypsophila vaccaria]
MADKREFIVDNRREDVSWINSLSETEIDVLIGLKDIAIQRVKVIGHESLGNKFDLKTLRALSHVLTKHVSGQVSDDLQLTGVDKLKELMGGDSLLKLNQEREDRNINQREK